MSEERRKDKRLRYLQRVADREAKKISGNLGRPLTRQEWLQLRIQTLEPWPRAIRIFFGTGFMTVGGYFFSQLTGYGIVFGGLFGVIGSVMIFNGLRGRNESVAEALDPYIF